MSVHKSHTWEAYAPDDPTCITCNEGPNHEIHMTDQEWFRSWTDERKVDKVRVIRRELGMTLEQALDYIRRKIMGR